MCGCFRGNKTNFRNLILGGRRCEEILTQIVQDPKYFLLWELCQIRVQKNNLN